MAGDHTDNVQLPTQMKPEALSGRVCARWAEASISGLKEVQEWEADPEGKPGLLGSSRLVSYVC